MAYFKCDLEFKATKFSSEINGYEKNYTEIKLKWDVKAMVKFFLIGYYSLLRTVSETHVNCYVAQNGVSA